VARKKGVVAVFFLAGEKRKRSSEEGESDRKKRKSQAGKDNGNA